VLANFNQSKLATLMSKEPVLETRNSRWALWLMHLSDQEIEFLNDRLHFTSDLLKTVRSIALLETNLTAVKGLKPSEAVDLLEGYPFKALEVVSAALPAGETKTILSQYLSEWWHIKPKTTGHDLKKHGIPPGPKYTEILHRLRAAWLDGEVKTEEEEKNLLSNLLR
jgi:tRNA nucleotidyltransferase (CCA-adding enzyme)